MSDDLGLRERKKLATRRTLCDAALRLVIDEGLENLSPERIAAAADVSPRTFRNYFASKEEAVVAAILDRGRSVPEALRARPPGEPILQSLRVAMVDSLGGFEQESDLRRLLRLVRCHRALLAEHLTSFESMGREMVAVIAERTGTDADRDLYPRLLADVTGIAVRTSLELWAQGDTGRTAGEIVTESFELLSRGLALPPPS